MTDNEHLTNHDSLENQTQNTSKTESHCFQVRYAVMYGIECALLIQHLEFWINQNARAGRNFYDGRTWMFQTLDEISAVCPYMSREQVHRNLRKLIDADVLLIGNYNTSKFKKTAWYAFKHPSITPPDKTFKTQHDSKKDFDIAKLQHRDCGTATSYKDTNTKDSSYDLKKQQQQKTKNRDPTKKPKQSPVVVVFPEPKKEEAVEKPIYPCLQEIDILKFEKEWLTNKYSEEVVQNAIGFAQENYRSFSKPFVAVIKYAAQKGLKCETQKAKNSTLSNAQLCEKIDGKVNKENTIRIDAFHDRVEFVCLTAYMLPVIIFHNDRQFKELMNHYLIKYGFKT